MELLENQCPARQRFSRLTSIDKVLAASKIFKLTLIPSGYTQGCACACNEQSFTSMHSHCHMGIAEPEQSSDAFCVQPASPAPNMALPQSPEI